MNNPLRGRAQFLEKKAEDWTDGDIDEFRRVYSACTKRYPAVNVSLNASPAQMDAHVEKVVSQLLHNIIEPARGDAHAQAVKAAATRQLAEEKEAREEQQREKVAQEERGNAEEASRRSAERAERARQRLREQAEQDRRATEDLLKQVEAEERKTAEIAKEAEVAKQARAAAEQRLADIRRKSESVEQKEGKSQSGDATATSAQRAAKMEATPTLGLIATDFSREFNDVSASMGFDLRASQNGCSSAVRTVCQFKINERTGVIVGSDNDNPRATGVTIILVPNGDPTEVTKALSSFMVVARMLSPSIKRQKDNGFVSQIFVGLKEKSESEATADGVRYQISTSAAGLWFTATPQAP
ncbi:hypothetical protein AB7535_35760 [Bradyrhizobium sp. 956_D2_N1_4]